MKRRQLWLDHRLLAGLGWLDTAHLEAQSEPVRLPPYQETVTRLAARSDTRGAAHAAGGGRPEVPGICGHTGLMARRDRPRRGSDGRDCPTGEKMARDAYIAELSRRHRAAQAQRASGRVTLRATATPGRR